MPRRRRNPSGPESVWRILRRIARDAARHEEWRCRFDREQRAREAAWRRERNAEDRAWRERLEAEEQAWRNRLAAEGEARREEAETRRKEVEERRLRLRSETAERRKEAEQRRLQQEAEAAERREEAEQWRLRQETEAAERRQESEQRRRQQEAEAAERSRKLEAEADDRRRKYEAEAVAREKQLREERAEFARLAAKRDEERRIRDAQADRKLERAIHRMIGDGDERFGRLIEALTEGDLAPLLKSAGFPVREPPLRRMGVSHGLGFATEFDLIAMGEAVTVVVEVKATLRPEYVKDFIDKLERFRGWFPDHSRGALHGAMAYLSATDTAPKMAGRRGLLLIRVVGSSASIVNEPGFTPRSF